MSINRWYQAIMVQRHELSGYEKDLLVNFKIDKIPDNMIAMLTEYMGKEYVNDKNNRVIVYDGVSKKYFTIPISEAGKYIQTSRDANKKLIPSESQQEVQYNFIIKCLR